MKAENITYAKERQFSFKFDNIDYDISLYLNDDGTNCKLSYIHGAGSLKDLSDDQRKQVVDYLLDMAKGTVLINTTNKEVSDFINKNYDTYYYNKVPIGYNDGYQYHILIRNNISPNGYCREPEKNTSLLDKQYIKETIKKTLKKLRRKADYVDDLVDSL